ncbi:MAG: SemiSWEET transporter [Holosporales bacterium]
MEFTAVELLGLFAGACTTSAFIPQVLQVWRSRSAKDISLGMYIIFCIGVASWLGYGVFLGAPSIIIANALTLCFALAILVMKLKWS